MAGLRHLNFGNPSEMPEASYCTLRLAMQQQKPKLRDVRYIDREQSEGRSVALSHLFLDEAPLSVQKLRAIDALFHGGSRAEFAFPLIADHGRWEELFTGVGETRRREPGPFHRNLSNGVPFFD